MYTYIRQTGSPQNCRRKKNVETDLGKSENIILHSPRNSSQASKMPYPASFFNQISFTTMMIQVVLRYPVQNIF